MTEPVHRARVTTTAGERRARELAAEVVELRSLVGDLGERNTRLEAELRRLREKEAATVHHWRAFLAAMGVETVEELKALLGRRGASTPGAGLDLRTLLAQERRRP